MSPEKKEGGLPNLVLQYPTWQSGVVQHREIPQDKRIRGHEEPQMGRGDRESLMGRIQVLQDDRPWENSGKDKRQ